MDDVDREPAAFWQHTLARSVSCTGIGLHSGRTVAMSLHPAAPDTGIVFRRSGPSGSWTETPARYDRVGGTVMSTNLFSAGKPTVGTIEHLMAALAGCEIDNAVVEIDGPEVPVMDGSAAPFVFLIECAGTVEQDEPRRAVRVLRPVEVREGDRWARLVPARQFAIGMTIDFESHLIGRQSLDVEVTAASFKNEIAGARTFGFLHEVEALREAGLARGGSLDNAVVVNGTRILNDGGLRFVDEFVRHKILDCVGDLYLAGGPIIGRYEGFKAGHGLNNTLLHALFADGRAWTLGTVEDNVESLPPRWRSPAIAATA